MRIAVHIERLVLDGLPVTAADGPRVRAALEGELAQLLAAGGLSRELAAGGAMPIVRAPPIDLIPRQRPAEVGQAIARSVHGGIGRAE